MHFQLNNQLFFAIFSNATRVKDVKLFGYLDKRAQVVFQPLLVTSGHYMYDDTEDTEQGSVTLGELIFNSIKYHKLQPHVMLLIN